MRTGHLLLTGFGLAFLTTSVTAKDTYVYGPPPDWEHFKQMGEAAVRQEMALPKVQKTLPQANSWSIEWPNGYTQFIWFHSGRFRGYTTCGILRADASAPGRRIVNFAVVIDYDTVKKVDISGKDSNSLVNIICAEMVSRGKLPPASVMIAPRDLVVERLGARIRIMPEGAYVVSVAPAAPGQAPALTSGTVITRVNGIALAGMGNAMAAILGSDAARLELDTATGERLLIERPR